MASSVTWKNSNGSVSTFAAYTRQVDAGNGEQRVLVYNGVIVEQKLFAHQGHYTGNGNPEIVDKPVSAIYGWGFTRIRSERVLDNLCENWIQKDENEE